MPLVNVFTCSPGTGGRSRAMVSPSNIIILSTSTQRHAATLGKHFLPALQFEKQPQPIKKCMKIKMVILQKQMHPLWGRLPPAAFRIVVSCRAMVRIGYTYFLWLSEHRVYKQVLELYQRVLVTKATKVAQFCNPATGIMSLNDCFGCACMW